MLADYREQLGTPFDELVGGDGAPRPGWDALAIDGWDAESLRSARGHAARLLEDDGVTYNPLPDSSPEPADSLAARRGTTRWRLDPLPTVIAADDWSTVEAGVAQRAQLLEAILADLYGPRHLLTSGLLPSELMWRHGLYLRQAWGVHPADRPRIVVAATDLGRDADGRWLAVSDHTQAPSGLGYAMENRRVVARLLPDAYRRSELRRLTGFFSKLREALANQAPAGIEDPRIVVLTPGQLSETAFDQAYIASLLGLPLVSGADLVMREGQIWTRELGDRRPVDVVLRRVDDVWCDPLELRADSQLGVAGFLEASRRGAVVTANALGSGLAESPALHPYLPGICQALLDEPLLLPSAESHWCGDPLGLAWVTENLSSAVIRPVNRSGGGGVYGPGLSAVQRTRWLTRIQRDPGGYVGQEVLPLSTTPTVAGFGLDARPLTLRSFAVARGSSYAVMPGALGRIVPDTFNPATGRRDRVALSKDVWVLRAADVEAAVEPEPEPLASRAHVVPMVPRALENLFWMGRYTERAEATTRHILVLRSLVDEFPFARFDPARGAVSVLARALSQATGTYPGLTKEEILHDEVIDAELTGHFVDRTRPGSLAQSLEGIASAAGSVRDQLSVDVFTVLGAIDRACGELVQEDDDPPARGSELVEAGVHVLSGTLALSGITSENMVRDVGWQLLDIGRGLERSLQTAALLRWVFGDVHPPAVERHLVGAVLTAGESVVTHRRRYPGSEAVDSMLELMLLDPTNPRSVAFQVARVRAGVALLPTSAAQPVLVTLLDEIEADLGSRTAAVLAASFPRLTETEELFTEHREELVGSTERLQARLRQLARVLTDGYFSPPVAPRQLGSRFSRPAPRQTQEA